MVVLDGTCYHLHADGSATIASPQDKTPFAAVLWFRPDKTIKIKESAERTVLTTLIDSAVARPNLTYAVRVTGSFGFRTPAYEQGISAAGYHLHRQRTPPERAPHRPVPVRRPVSSQHQRANRADRR
jgi:acetolactate decarboxylase